MPLLPGPGKDPKEDDEARAVGEESESEWLDAFAAQKKSADAEARKVRKEAHAKGKAKAKPAAAPAAAPAASAAPPVGPGGGVQKRQSCLTRYALAPGTTAPGAKEHICDADSTLVII